MNSVAMVLNPELDLSDSEFRFIITALFMQSQPMKLIAEVMKRNPRSLYRYMASLRNRNLLKVSKGNGKADMDFSPLFDLRQYCQKVTDLSKSDNIVTIKPPFIQPEEDIYIYKYIYPPQGIVDKKEVEELKRENERLKREIEELKSKAVKTKKRSKASTDKMKATKAIKKTERWLSIFNACNEVFCFGDADLSKVKKTETIRCVRFTQKIHDEFTQADGSTVIGFKKWWKRTKINYATKEPLTLPAHLYKVIHHMKDLRQELEDKKEQGTTFVMAVDEFAED